MNELLNGIPWGAFAPIIVLQLILMFIALVSCIKEEKTNGPKWLWVLVILIIGIIGPVLYLVVGRRND
ncbi:MULTISPECIES: PLDc N-terminal domain-containing protein [Cytobacillus]|uniref:PLDc N-terminal domain-containing protein n=1 Tax=Cytobacillus TaxID=2675230 RepID=UPI001CD28358|nr:PLDc N-terminal domain-containing protein [Cytobacillus kochii]MCA1028663.1 PLDc N-terminal domain-containing protein [Cytobacillus kochii]MCM3324210.1 PLDc N-terminal domain-containing protein [Cytobacillus kochii]MCM3346721.1 PLDc N-terminal domain-containing protein [Cytobacillus kochii]MDM5205586.1 PLDc N-terminal domain-containing protein [Cytobacillus kochii]